MEIKDFVAPLIKWWWLVFAAVLVATVVSLFATSQQPPIYEAKTTLMIGRAIEDPNPSNVQFNLGQQLAATYADIARRDPVRNATMAALGLQNWLPRYIVRPVQNTQLIEIIVTDTNPDRAQAVANELASQLILQSPTNPQQEEQERLAFINQQLDQLEEQIQATQSEVAARQEELANLVSASKILETQNQVSALQAKLTTLQTNYASMLATTQSGAINTLSVIETARGARQVGPNILLTALTAAGIGLVLSSGAAYLLEYMDNTVKTPGDVNRAAALPVLAGIAHIKGDEPASKLISMRQPRAPVSEAYRKLRTAIQFASIDSPDRSSLLITSTNPTEGKSVTVANLGTVMAQAGNRVLIIDADLRRPSQHMLFGFSNGRGLTSFLLKVDPHSNEAEFDLLTGQLVHPTAVEGLYLLTSGPIPPNPSELLGSAKMKVVVQTLADKFDFVVLDSPPLLAVTDAEVLSTQVDNVLLVTHAGRTQQQMLQRAVEHLREINANIIGVVLNRLSARDDNYYYYRNAYYDEEEEEAASANVANGRLLRDFLQRKRRNVTSD